MANPEHLAVLAQGVEAWNAWREANEGVLPDLREADLFEARLGHANLFGAQLAGSVLCGADLKHADLSGADLSGADLTRVNLSFARMMATDFRGADLRGSDLAFADLEMAKLHEAMLFEGDPEHLAILESGVAAWNAWRRDQEGMVPDLTGANFRQRELHNIDLRNAILRNASFVQCWFFGADFTGAVMHGARLTGSDLSGVSFKGAELSHVYMSRASLHLSDLSGANLPWAKLHDAGMNEARLAQANLANADLLRADLFEAKLDGAVLDHAVLFQANLTGADLSGARLHSALLDRARMSEANLTNADFTGASLMQATLVDSILDGASLSNCFVYGISAWGLDLSSVRDQSNLVITPNDEAEVTVDNVEVAQFIYMMLHNRKIRDVIDTITGKGVLILGRFTEARKAVLDGIKDRLRERNLVPIVFDWDKPTSRDLTETVQLLANMSRFVVADVTDAKSIPQELTSIVPNLPSVPVRPLILSGQREYAMFEHFEAYPWVLPLFEYADEGDLLDNIEEAILEPIQRWETGTTDPDSVQQRLREQEAEIARLKAELARSATGSD
ncbi:MAG: pentapeptide repeat-containing protein [Gemmatimonadota bacterium]